MGRKKLVRDEEDVPPPIIKLAGATKSKKKTVVIDDDEYAIGTDASLEDCSNQVNGVLQEVGAVKLEPKKQSNPIFRQDVNSVPVISGKKKTKVKKDGISSRSGFGLLEVDDNEEIVLNKIEHDDRGFEEAELDGVVFTGNKKPSKATKKPSSKNVLDAALEYVDNGDTGFPLGDSDVNGVQTISFSGKKKPSKHKKEINKTSMFSAFGELDTGEVKDDEKPGLESEICCPEKTLGDLSKHVKDEDAAPVTFDGKKKPSKKKAASMNVSHEPDKKPTGELEEQLNTVPHENVNNNNKKKKKKPGRTAQEEEDLDKILAELGGGSTALPEIAPAVDIVEATLPENTAEEGIESAAAKKRKKKKEKEKERKTAAGGPKENEKKTEVKNIPKHVREMQEALARRKEAEERQKKEDEEKERREKEEIKKQEELARLAEEAKRRKKEKEKEKIQKKKQEGKFLTGKQKEEARRLEAMRNQILANSGGLPLSSGDGVTGPMAKRPIYLSKRSRVPSAQPVDAVVLPEAIPEAEAETDREKSDVVDEEKTEAVDEHKSDAVAEEENEEEEEDDDWDAKSWDDTIVVLPEKKAFADEEAESEPEPEIAPVVRKEIKGGKAAEPIRPGLNKGVMEEEMVEAGKTEEELRSPICCIMGHVDTGKTKLLDCIRGTNVQEGEAGGITQQIGATYFPAENIRERTKELKADAKLKVPGLLVIDTPGHESFSNLRSRGSGLCDIAVLVVDIMHGLEPQTVESINLLKMKSTEFIVALNKVDRLYGWKVCRNSPIVKALKQQTKDVQNEFNMRLIQIITQFKEQGLNTELYYKNREMKETFSIVPTSAITGEGIPDLLLLLVQWTQKTMVEKLTFSHEIQCTVLEVKVVEGHGTTIDVVLVNGVLHEGDQIVVCGMQGPIVTTIRALLTPHPMKELRIKGTYLHHKQIKAAQGIKITAQGLEHAVAGTGLHVVGHGEEVEEVKERAMEDMKSVMSKIDKTGEGVYVQASTLGSLEALLEFLKSPAVMIPVSGIGIGPVHKKDVMKASVMLEKKKKEFGTILAFDVKITQEARELSEELGVKIFIADIIYHLFDQFKAYLDTLKEERKKDAADDVVFPCLLKIIPNCIFNKKDPIVLGVDVLEGIVKIGTQICVPEKEFVDIGRVASIEFNHKPVDVAKKGQKVAIKLVGSSVEEQQKIYGRHFEIEDTLVSHITRRSIDILKTSYRDELNIEEWKLLVKLKNLFKIQ